MPFVFKRLFLFMSIAAFAADKESVKFDVRPASQYKAKQTNAKVTIAAQVLVSDDEARPAFGKNNPYKYGVLPVLVIVQNDSPVAVSLERIRVEYIPADRGRIEATPAKDVRFVTG